MDELEEMTSENTLVNLKVNTVEEMRLLELAGEWRKMLQMLNLIQTELMTNIGLLSRYLCTSRSRSCY